MQSKSTLTFVYRGNLPLLSYAGQIYPCFCIQAKYAIDSVWISQWCVCEIDNHLQFKRPYQETRTLSWRPCGNRCMASPCAPTRCVNLTRTKVLPHPRCVCVNMPRVFECTFLCLCVHAVFACLCAYSLCVCEHMPCVFECANTHSMSVCVCFQCLFVCIFTMCPFTATNRGTSLHNIFVALP